MKIQEYLNREIRCSCGRIHRCDIGGLRIDAGALDALGELTASFSHILLAADTNTAPLAAERAAALLGDRCEGLCLFSPDGLLVPDEKSIAQLTGSLTERTDLVLGIGSGVINDLCKYAAFSRGIRSGIIATAPSMDGFASSGAAMILGGMKVTVTTRAPEVIIGDTDILSRAPVGMIRAGYADIIGKYSSLCDWKLSALINGEHFCPMIYDLVKESTDEVRGLVGELTQRRPEAIGRLTEILVLIGACLTLLGSTRPGSGSEHHLSHFFEITGLIRNRPYFLHGIDVGYASVVTARLREEIRAVPSPVFHRVPDEVRRACYAKIYGAYSPEVGQLQETAGRYDGAPQEERFADRWEQIRQILAECPTPEEFTAMLSDAGFDMDAFEKMYGRETIEEGIWFGKDLKDRYSVLWLYFRLFFTPETARKLLGGSRKEARENE